MVGTFQFLTMTRQSGRKRKNKVSESWYVGYAEDQESVEAIMKKFQELDQLKEQLKNDNDTDQLNTTQLEELFKRTSAFTVKSAQLNEFDPLEIYHHENGNDTDDDDYEVADDDFWDQITRKTSKDKKDNTQSILQKYRMQEVQVQDKMGNYYLLKKRILVADPNLPTYIRIPTAPLSRAWARIIKPLHPTDLVCSKVVKGNILSFNFKQFSKYQGIDANKTNFGDN